MPEESLLLTIAEVSIGFAGFAGIVALFGRRGAGSWSTADRVRFDALIRFALLSLFAAFLPLAIHYVSPDHGSPWRLASTILGLVLLAMFWRGRRRIAEVRASADSEANVPGGWVLLGVNVLIALGLFLNAAGVIFQADAGPYLVALFLSLTCTGLMFARLLRFA
jgi:MYXO-CTERM domain-containing protein